MPLQSTFFKGDHALEACLIRDAAHVTKGVIGIHVSKIQRALLELENVQIDAGELSLGQYGRSTAAAVLAFKTKRNIINRNYQTRPDDIVGKMTIAALDREILAKDGPDSEFLGCNDQQKNQIRSDLQHAKNMLDVVLARLRTVAHITSSGGLLVIPRNLEMYDTKLKIRDTFLINTFVADDLPPPPGILPELRQRFNGLQELPQPSLSPLDALNFADLLANFIRLRQSLNERFLKEFYTMGTFKGSPIGFFAAFVDASNPADPIMRFTRRYFDPGLLNGDDRAVTIAHERAHTIFRANGHPGTGDNPFCVAPHLGDPNVKSTGEALENPYCYEWLINCLQPTYDPDHYADPAACGTLRYR